MKKKGSVIVGAVLVTVFSLLLGLICGMWAKVWLFAYLGLIWLTETTVCVLLWSIVWFPILLLWTWLDRSKKLPDVQKRVTVLSVVVSLAAFGCAFFVSLDSSDFIRDLRPTQTLAAKAPPKYPPHIVKPMVVA